MTKNRISKPWLITIAFGFFLKIQTLKPGVFFFGGGVGGGATGTSTLDILFIFKFYDKENTISTNRCLCFYICKTICSRGSQNSLLRSVRYWSLQCVYACTLLFLVWWPCARRCPTIVTGGRFIRRGMYFSCVRDPLSVVTGKFSLLLTLHILIKQRKGDVL